MVDNFYINQTLDKFHQFLGVFAANHLDENLFRKNFSSVQYVIINTEHLESGEEGHWISLSRYKDKKGRVILEFFDSLAWPVILLDQNIRKTIQNARFDIFVTNNKMIQHPRSKYCGFYTIARFLGLLKENNISDFLSHFTCDLTGNDRRVLRYIRKMSK